MISRALATFKTKNKQMLVSYFSVVIFLGFMVIIVIFNISPYLEEINFDENQKYKISSVSTKILSQMYTEKIKYSDLGGLCPDASTIVVTVIAGGRLGNQVWEYLSVWAVARNHPGWWPAVPRQILYTLQPLFSPLTIPAIEDLAERCNASFWLEEMKNCSDGGNQDLLQAALDDTNRSRPFLLVLHAHSINVNATAIYWRELRFQLPLTSKLQISSELTLRRIGKKIRNAQNLKDNEQLTFVGVHVRRTDYPRYLKSKFSDAKPANHNFYLKAMEEMRRQLHPRHCAFVVVSDDLAWCREYLTGAPDVEIAGTGDISNPYYDLALLSACNHSVFAYGTFSLTAAMQHPLGKTIVHAGGGSRISTMQFAKIFNWTLV